MQRHIIWKCSSEVESPSDTRIVNSSNLFTSTSNAIADLGFWLRSPKKNNKRTV